MRLPFVLSILLISVHKARLLNILAVLPYEGKSHFMVYNVYLKELSKRGHNVTVISHFPEENPPKNYKNIGLAAGSTSAVKRPFETTNFPYHMAFLSSYYLTTTGVRNCEEMLANREVQSIIKRKNKFDVVVVEMFNSDCALGVAYKIGAPVVGISSDMLKLYYFKRFGIPDNPSYATFHFSDGGSKPTFVQRLEKTFFQFYFNVMYSYTQWMNQRTLAKYFDDIPPLEELGRDIKFVLLYTNFVFTGSNLLPANAIEVGGYHVTAAKPLSGDLQKFVDEAEHGVVYIGFGSVLDSATCPPEKTQAILEAMKEFPQRFIWKWESDIFVEDKSKLYISSWLPQADILGHRKTLAFLSHGGMAGANEALYFGVPMIAMPFFGDQPFNAAAIKESGLGIQLQYMDLTKENLVSALKTVLDPEFNKRVQEISKAWRDRPISPLDSAVFWTEFAAKHPNFTYRTAAADVPLYQYLYLDVIFTFLMFLVMFGYAIKTCFSSRTKLKGKIMKFKLK